MVLCNAHADRHICERPHKNLASCIIAYCSGSGINEIANEVVRLCGIVRGTVNRMEVIDLCESFHLILNLSCLVQKLAFS